MKKAIINKQNEIVLQKGTSSTELFMEYVSDSTHSFCGVLINTENNIRVICSQWSDVTKKNCINYINNAKKMEKPDVSPSGEQC